MLTARRGIPLLLRESVTQVSDLQARTLKFLPSVIVLVIHSSPTALSVFHTLNTHTKSENVHIKDGKIKMKESFLGIFPISGKDCAELTRLWKQWIVMDGDSKFDRDS